MTGLSKGVGSAVGKYIVGGVRVLMQKALVSPSPEQLIPGVTIVYRILVELAGEGSVADLQLADPMPAEINYLANSATINGASRSDAADSDNLQFAHNTLSVLIGHAVAPISYAIEFKATLK